MGVGMGGAIWVRGGARVRDLGIDRLGLGLS